MAETNLQTVGLHTVGVIVGQDLIGDGLYKLPFLRAMRAALPAAKITWITTEGATVFGGMLRTVTAPLIDEVVERAPIGSRFRDLFRPQAFTRRFDLLIDTRGRWQQAACSRRVAHGRFISPAARFLFADARPGLTYRKPAHIVDRLNDLLWLATGRHPEPLNGALALPKEVMELAAQALPSESIYVGFAPGASMDHKIWPLARFIEVAVIQEARGRRPVFLLGPTEIELQTALADAVPGALFPLQDERVWGAKPLTVERTIAIATRLVAAVANDSGTSHMIGAADCPLVSLFGPTSPDKLAPRVSCGVIVRAQQFGSSEITAIPIPAVVDALEELVAWA
ncbi:Glycosyltransferase family 9 protein [uncultured Gammaproteobacteria bacterium]